MNKEKRVPNKNKKKYRIEHIEDEAYLETVCTIEEICKETGLNFQTVKYHLSRQKKRGFEKNGYIITKLNN